MIQLLKSKPRLFKKDDNNSIHQASKFKLLLVQPGYSFPQQFNYYELIIRLIGTVYNTECDVLVCDKAVLACDFRSGLGQMPETIPKGWDRSCKKCSKKLLHRVKSFSTSAVYLSDLISEHDKSLVVTMISDLPNPSKDKDIIDIEYGGVNIGRDIWQSIIYYFKMGNPGLMRIIPGSVVYEYIYSGLIMAIASKKLFKKCKYNIVLANETTYVDWGIAVKFALKSRTPVIRNSRYYIGKEFFRITLYRDISELTGYPHFPKDEEVKEVFNNNHKRRKIALYGKNSLTQWLTKGVPLKHGSATVLDNCIPKNVTIDNHHTKEMISKWFRPNRKTVVIFTKLCWEPSLNFGGPVFLTYEKWLIKTFEIACKIKKVDWIFRLHPKERSDMTSKHANTDALLKKLMSDNPNDHIKIMDGNTKLRTYDLIPHMHAGVTTFGTVMIELTPFGVPCIYLGKRKFFGCMTLDADTKEKYEEILMRVHDIRPLSATQQEKASAFVGMVFDKSNYLNVRKLFINPDLSDKKISKKKLSEWTMTEENRNYIKVILNSIKTNVDT